MEREALVVGINKYPRLGDLDMPEADAKAIADILETYGGFKVTRHRVRLLLQRSKKEM
jgi:uncharacterized caspase-like protein